MNLIGESIAMFPDFDKLYLMMGQLLIRQNKHNDARGGGGGECSLELFDYYMVLSFLN